MSGTTDLKQGFQEAGAQFAAPANDPTTDTDFESLEKLANAIVMAQGIDRPTEETWGLAHNLLKNFESLLAIQRANFETLQKHGVDWQVFKAFQCMYEFQCQALEEPLKRKISISSWPELVDYLTQVYGHSPTEEFWMLFLDKKNMLLKAEKMGEGTVDHVPVYPREVAKRALQLNASAIILTHNHPSGDPTPSPEDIAMTEKVAAACNAIGVIVHDHAVVGKRYKGDRPGSHVQSFRALGLL